MRIFPATGLLLLLCCQLKAQNVGIGTATPGGKLQLNHRATSTSPTLLFFDSSTLNGARLRFLNASTPRYWDVSSITNNISRSAHYFDFQTDSSIILTLRGNGLVGINNLGPAWPLDVRGDINFTGALRVNGSAGTAGQVLTSNGASGVGWTNAPTGSGIGFNVGMFTAPVITPAAANIPLPFDWEHFDDGNGFNVSNHRYTVPSDGVYHIDVSVDMPSPPAGRFILTLRNPNSASGNYGGDIKTVPQGTNRLIMTISTTQKLAAGTGMAVFLITESSTSIANTVSTQFSCFKVY